MLDARYEDPSSSEGLGPFAALYLSLSLVVLSPVSPLPADVASRVVFVVMPLAGLLLLGQLIVRLVVAVLSRDRWEVAMASTYSNHVIVCGLGRVGFRVVRWLLDLRRAPHVRGPAGVEPAERVGHLPGVLDLRPRCPRIRRGSDPCAGRLRLRLRRGRRQHHPAHHHQVHRRAGVDGIVVSATPEGLDKLACLTPPTRELGRYRQGRWQLRPVDQ